MQIFQRFPKRYFVAVAILSLLALGLLAYQIPGLRARLDWQREVAVTYLRGVINPVQPIPTPLPQPTLAATQIPTFTPQPSPTPEPTRPPEEPTPTQTPTPTPLPGAVSLRSPTWVLQAPNNCGPASLTMYLSYYGWSGTQEDIAKLIKPLSEDRNVNPEEMLYYVRNRAGWLRAEFRVGGTIDQMKQLLAAGFPVIIEESFKMDADYWPNDDRWAAHYLLLTGYDDGEGIFIAQDSFHGPDQRVGYAEMDADWKIFNRVYFLVYLPEQEETLKSLLGPDWDVENNRRRALETAEAEIAANAGDAYAWFNKGSNLVYYERYLEASLAYDQARILGLPQRMLRYQFGPFFAYFHSGRTDDLLALTEYALQRTPNAEEALLWEGWGLYRKGQRGAALESFQKALEANPLSPDAKYALDFIRQNP